MNINAILSYYCCCYNKSEDKDSNIFYLNKKILEDSDVSVTSTRETELSQPDITRISNISRISNITEYSL